jgi:glycosyltransferase involved in cell wall biosynthesis
MNKVAFFLCSNVIGGHEFQSVEFALSSISVCQPCIFLNTIRQLDLVKNTGLNYKIVSKPFFRDGFFLIQYFVGLKERRRLRKLVKTYDTIIICAGTVEAGIALGVALSGLNIYLYVPMYIDRRWLWGDIGYLYNLLFKYYLIPYNGIITINDIQQKYFQKWKKVFVLPNLIYFNDCISSEGDSPNSNRRLYFVGRLDVQKRLDELINWLDSPKNPFHEFIVIGDGQLRDKYLAVAKKCKYINVSFLGWIPQSQQNLVVSGNDVFILNSIYEGEPLAILEANHRGSIVLARNIVGVYTCTLPSNRFNNREELLTKLHEAYDGMLNIFENPTLMQIQEERSTVIHELFL